MKILGLRTDNPEAELYIYEVGKQLAEIKWAAHRQLAGTLNSKIEEILNKSSIVAADLDGIVVYEGPGSFTGLRIGLTVANAMAYGLEIPIVAAGGPNWIGSGTKALQAGKNDRIALPKYGAEPHVTKPRK